MSTEQTLHELKKVTDFLVVSVTALFIFGIWASYIVLFIESVRTDPYLSYFIIIVVVPASFLLLGAEYSAISNLFKKMLLEVER